MPYVHSIAINISMLIPWSQIGTSLFDEAGSQKVAALVEKAKQRNISIVFPVDHVIADKFDKDAKVCWLACGPPS